jgi:class 3 adenylate cyclase
MNGQILISGRVHEAVERLIESEELAELTLKGFHRAVATVNVSGLREEPASGTPW